jgi:hypothetical protein
MDPTGRRVRTQSVRAKLALVLLVGLALSVPASAPGKGFTRVVLVSSDGRSVEVRGSEAEIDVLLSRRGALERIRGGYLRLFFVGPGDFPANPARYYPDPGCVALDWPTSETSCRLVEAAVARLLRPALTLARFRLRPTVLARIAYSGHLGRHLKKASALKDPVELALDRRGHAAPKPRGCYPLRGVWRGPRAALRPRRFLLCSGGVYAAGRLYPLGRGVWAWLRVNVGPPPAVRTSARAPQAGYTTAGLTAPRPRPGAVILDARSCHVLASVPIDEAITSAVPDGRRGWYVGGSFTRIGGQPRRALAHLLPNGGVDARWRGLGCERPRQPRVGGGARSLRAAPLRRRRLWPCRTSVIAPASPRSTSEPTPSSHRLSRAPTSTSSALR